VKPDQAQPELSAHPSFHNRDWAMQRASAVFFALILTAAAAGLFGSGGPLANATAINAEARAAFERFPHRECQTSLDLRAPATSNGQAVLDIRGDLLTNSEVQSISPTPSQQLPIPGGVRMTFLVPPGEPARITIRLTPKDAGVRRASLLLNGVPLDLSVFVYP
jgi:hypothetical protein